MAGCNKARLVSGDREAFGANDGHRDGDYASVGLVLRNDCHESRIINRNARGGAKEISAYKQFATVEAMFAVIEIFIAVGLQQKTEIALIPFYSRRI